MRNQLVWFQICWKNVFLIVKEKKGFKDKREYENLYNYKIAEWLKPRPLGGGNSHVQEFEKYPLKHRYMRILKVNML